MICEVADEVVHGLDHGGVIDETSTLLAGHKAGVRQLFQMKRKRGVGQSQLLGNRTGGKTVRRVLDQQPIDRQPRPLSERGKDREDLFGLHSANSRLRTLRIGPLL